MHIYEGAYSVEKVALRDRVDSTFLSSHFHPLLIKSYLLLTMCGHNKYSRDTSAASVESQASITERGTQHATPHGARGWGL